MECIVKFDVVYPHEIKSLRGLVFVDQDAMPGTEQLIGMFKDMSYQVTADPADPMRFLPAGASSTFEYIRIRELDTGEQKFTEDRDLKNLLSNLLPNQNRPI
ncbi:hypothetical protein [Paenibacillus bovis]|uniref:Uncharacterized protein n=1 Tax=Paenibacillus bovis TaxID=1616788 RepID=A0A172ZCR5_9BACL|nr:hypothetical protein [Paenibacillus bovis]ANF95446.1 hypothetical protein AR543_05085 [Paenibacillus bovis]